MTDIKGNRFILFKINKWIRISAGNGGISSLNTSIREPSLDSLYREGSLRIVLKAGRLYKRLGTVQGCGNEQGTTYVVDIFIYKRKN